MNTEHPKQSEPAQLTAVFPDGRRASVSEGEFRSLEGKLLFVRRGNHIEIRCPRSKAIYAIELTAVTESHHSGQPKVNLSSYPAG